MKSSLKVSLLMMLATAIAFTSCVKNDVKSYYAPGANPMLNSTATTLVLTQATAATTASTFTWSAADFGYKAAITYTLQFSKGGTNFSSPATTTEVAVGTATKKIMTVGELNAKMQEIITDGVATAIDVRVKAEVGAAVAPIYSNVVRLTVTSYLDIVSYGFPDAMNVAGNYQGWDPASAPQIARVRNGGYQGYEGYIIFTDPSPQFKIVKGNNWGAGDYGANGAGVIASPSGNNITLPSGGAGLAGLYRLRANTTALTWSYYKVNTFGIIGSATANGWNSSTPMTFNPSNGSWSITTNLTAGEMKFRANDDWAVNFGDNDNPGDNKPEYDGSNIQVALAGNYTITLNIGIAGNYSYKLKKN